MTNDLISRSELKKALRQRQWHIDDIEEVEKIIDNVPTVNIIQHKDWYLVNKAGAKELLDRERPHGEWIFHKDFNESCRYGCNQCGNLTNIPSNFCPNCGADMRGGAE